MFKKSCKIILLFCSFILSSCQKQINNENLTKIHKKDIIQIAILMPSTGDEATLGYNYDMLIRQGLDVLIENKKLHVTSYDVSNEEKALDAVNKIIAKNTKIILGPIYSDISSLIAEKIKNQDIIMITMSNNPVLADENVIVFGHAPMKQLEKIIDYFIADNKKYFMSILPESDYSKNINKILQEVTVKNNAHLLHTAFYKNNIESIKQSTESVIKKVDEINERDDIEEQSIIFIADDYRNLDLLFENIMHTHLDKKSIIAGDNRLDSHHNKDIDIVFTGSSDCINQDLRNSFNDLGINNISFMHFLAYDMGKITAHYINAIESEGSHFTIDKFKNALVNNLVYHGTSGHIYFVDNIAYRKYDILKRANKEYNVLLTWDTIIDKQ